MLTEAATLSPTNVVTFTNMNNEDQLLRFSRNTCYKSSPWVTTMHLLNVTRVLQQRPTRNLPVGGDALKRAAQPERLRTYVGSDALGDRDNNERS